MPITGGVDDELEAVLPLVTKIAWKYFGGSLPHGVEMDDLIGAGVVAAMQAATRWDPDGGAKLLTYIGRRAHGAMHDELARYRSGPMSDPHRYTMVSLDSASEDVTELHDEDAVDPLDAVLAGDLRQALNEALDSLPAEVGEAIRLFYIEGLTAKEVALRIGRSEAATYQTIYHHLARLREHPALLAYAPSADKAHP